MENSWVNTNSHTSIIRITKVAIDHNTFHQKYKVLYRPFLCYFTISTNPQNDINKIVFIYNCYTIIGNSAIQITEISFLVYTFFPISAGIQYTSVRKNY